MHPHDIILVLLISVIALGIFGFVVHSVYKEWKSRQDLPMVSSSYSNISTAREPLLPRHPRGANVFWFTSSYDSADSRRSPRYTPTFNRSPSTNPLVDSSGRPVPYNRSKMSYGTTTGTSKATVHSVRKYSPTTSTEQTANAFPGHATEAANATGQVSRSSASTTHATGASASTGQTSKVSPSTGLIGKNAPYTGLPTEVPVSSGSRGYWKEAQVIIPPLPEGNIHALISGGNGYMSSQIQTSITRK